MTRVPHPEPVRRALINCRNLRYYYIHIFSLGVPFQLQDEFIISNDRAAKNLCGALDTNCLLCVSMCASHTINLEGPMGCIRVLILYRRRERPKMDGGYMMLDGLSIYSYMLVRRRRCDQVRAGKAKNHTQTRVRTAVAARWVSVSISVIPRVNIC